LGDLLCSLAKSSAVLTRGTPFQPCRGPMYFLMRRTEVSSAAAAMSMATTASRVSGALRISSNSARFSRVIDRP